MSNHIPEPEPLSLCDHPAELCYSGYPETTLIIGRRGCGKTFLLKKLLALFPFDKVQRVVIVGDDPWDLEPHLPRTVSVLSLKEVAGQEKSTFEEWLNQREWEVNNSINYRSGQVLVIADDVRRFNDKHASLLAHVKELGCHVIMTAQYLLKYSNGIRFDRLFMFRNFMPPYLRLAQRFLGLGDKEQVEKVVKDATRDGRVLFLKRSSGHKPQGIFSLDTQTCSTDQNGALTQRNTFSQCLELYRQLLLQWSKRQTT